MPQTTEERHHSKEVRPDRFKWLQSFPDTHTHTVENTPMKRPRKKKTTTKADIIVKRRSTLKFRCPTQAFDLPVSTTTSTPVTRQISDEELNIATFTNGNTTQVRSASTPIMPTKILTDESLTTGGFSPSLAFSSNGTSPHSISDTSLDGKQARHSFLKRRANSMCLAELASAAQPEDPPPKQPREEPSPKSTVAAWGLFVDVSDETTTLRMEHDRQRRLPLRFRRRAPLQGFVLKPPPLTPPTVEEATDALDQLCVSHTF